MGAASAGIGAVGGIAQTIIGAGQARKARKAIENYDRQDITNLSTGLKVSTKGADLATQELSRTNATTVSALKAGGVRALMGGIPKIQAATIKQAAKIGVDLDEQVIDVQKQEIAGAEKARDMIERREEADLAGLGQQMSAGQQTMASGLAGFAGSMGQMGTLLGEKEA
jgi:hypothetical protein